MDILFYKNINICYLKKSNYFSRVQFKFMLVSVFWNYYPHFSSGNTKEAKKYPIIPSTFPVVTISSVKKDINIYLKKIFGVRFHKKQQHWMLLNQFAIVLSIASAHVRESSGDIISHFKRETMIGQRAFFSAMLEMS